MVKNFPLFTHFFDTKLSKCFTYCVYLLLVQWHVKCSILIICWLLTCFARLVLVLSLSINNSLLIKKPIKSIVIYPFYTGGCFPEHEPVTF